jgi:hypothetical protein
VEAPAVPTIASPWCNFSRHEVLWYCRKKRHHQSWRIRMRMFLSSLAIAAPILLHSNLSMAKGCLKGAAVGAVAGHLAGHHAVAGAAAGCVIGHHHAKVKDREAAQAAHTQVQQQPVPAPPSAPASSKPGVKDDGDWL